jgi:hypothetical protein
VTGTAAINGGGGAFGGREWLDEVPTYPRNMMGDRGPLI